MTSSKTQSAQLSREERAAAKGAEWLAACALAARAARAEGERQERLRGFSLRGPG